MRLFSYCNGIKNDRLYCLNFFISVGKYLVYHVGNIVKIIINLIATRCITETPLILQMLIPAN